MKVLKKKKKKLTLVYADVELFQLIKWLLLVSSYQIFLVLPAIMEKMFVKVKTSSKFIGIKSQEVCLLEGQPQQFPETTTPPTSAHLTKGNHHQTSDHQNQNSGNPAGDPVSSLAGVLGIFLRNFSRLLV